MKDRTPMRPQPTNPKLRKGDRVTVKANGFEGEAVVGETIRIGRSDRADLA